MVFPPDQAVVSGKDAIRKFVAESFKLPGFAIRWETTQVTVSPAGDLAYGAGTNEFTVNGADGKPITIAGNAVTVWRKEPDDTWKCVIDIWNSAAPPNPAGAK
jgi:ketosteroid isomerase-like protein